MRLMCFCLFFLITALCLSAKSNNIISISGNVVEKENFGPPNFGETPEQDVREISYFVFFDTPKQFIVNGEKKEIKEMQLIFYKLSNNKNEFIPDRNYLFTGHIESAETGHHHSNFIFIVDEYHLEE